MKNFFELIAESHQEVASLLISKDKSVNFLKNLIQLLFPHRSSSKLLTPDSVEQTLNSLEKDLVSILQPFCCDLKTDCVDVASRFFKTLPEIYQSLESDAQAIFEMDPAAVSKEEVIVTYPGFFAIIIYRIAHWFYLAEVPLFPRILAEYAHQQTGIDIHPGAQVGKDFAIDHGTGIVIGETSVIGNRVRIYQGVTLGGLVVDKQMQNKQRHPTIGNDVVIYANATILGGATVVGHGTVIGGNVWLTESVPPNSKVYHQSQVQIKSK